MLVQKKSMIIGMVTLGLAFMATPVKAQVPVYTNPYVPYEYKGPLGGALSGSADVINAQNAQMTELQKAKLLREQVEQKKMETRRKLFEERRYELANTPTLQDEQEALKERELRRAMRTPTMVDIWSGESLNRILEDAITKQARGIKGPVIAISPESLKNINVVTGTGGNVAMLNDSSSKLTWPIPLLAADYEADRKKLDDLFAQVYSQGKADAIERAALPTIDNHIAALRGLLRKNIDDLSPSENIESVRFLNQLSETVKALKNPKAGNYFNGNWTAKGKTVDELVRHMSEQGLRFGPVTPGNEPMYTAFYASMAAYDGSLVGELRTDAPKR